MAEPLRICVDRVLAQKSLPSGFAERLALVKDSKWPDQYGLRIRFLDGDPVLQQRVRQAAEIWMQHMGLTLLFGAREADAEIRIAFRPGGSWSFIGTQCRQVPKSDPTMNFGWLRPDSAQTEVERVVLHEFGHALGCIHEHQNPAGGIAWNRAAVYAYYAGAPNYWSPAQVDINIFQVYNADLTCHTAVDRKSIMMYPIDASLTTDGYAVGLNSELSPTDQQYIRQMYP
jgi:serralysin